MTNCKSQCYAGAANMCSYRSGVSTQIYVNRSALNLASSDSVKGSKLLRTSLDTSFEISKQIKLSPRHEAIFNKIKDKINPVGVGFQTLCPI